MLSELFSMQECQKGKKKWKQTEKKTKGMRYVVKICLSLLSDSVTCMYSCKFGKKKYLTVDIGGTCPFKTICLACNIKVVSGKTAVNWKKKYPTVEIVVTLSAMLRTLKVVSGKTVYLACPDKDNIKALLIPYILAYKYVAPISGKYFLGQIFGNLLMSCL